MSYLKIAPGWSVKMATAHARLGRLVMWGGDYWDTNDRYPSYPGYDGWNGTQHQSFHDALLGALIDWVTEGVTGANIGLWGYRQVGSQYAYGSQFEAALVRLGHTVTNHPLSGGWQGSDPRNYDVCIGTFTDGSVPHPVTGVSSPQISQLWDLCVNYNCNFMLSLSTAGTDLKATFGLGPRVVYDSDYYMKQAYNTTKHVMGEGPWAGVGGMISYTDPNIQTFTPTSGTVTKYHSDLTNGSELNCPIGTWEP
jgi:hypothetical protein